MEVEFKDALTGDVLMTMDGFGVSATCFEGLNWWPGETQNRGAFQLCNYRSPHRDTRTLDKTDFDSLNR